MMKPSGTYVALVTPFRGGEVDETAFRALVRHCIDGGVDGIVPCGTTGETPTLSSAEIEQVISLAVDEANGQVPVIAGSGANCTSKTIVSTRRVQELGCDAALVVTPYYNKPGQAGLEAHYREVCKAVPGFPVVLYNVPGRTGCNLLPQTVINLSDIDEVVAVKEASGNLAQVQAIINGCGDRISVLSGDDILSLPMYSMGGHGVISVAGNVVPDKMSAIYNQFKAGDATGAAATQAQLAPLFDVLFVESNPQPCKAALWKLGLMENELRLPLQPVTSATMERVKSVCADLGLNLVR